MGTRQWEKADFNCHYKPGFRMPRVGDLVCSNQMPKGKAILVGVQPLGAVGSEATMWMCPCGWLTPLAKPDK